MARNNKLLKPLTPREREIARELASGETVKEVAEALKLNPYTVQTYVRQVHAKLCEVSGKKLCPRVMIVHYALYQGWVENLFRSDGYEI